MSALASERREPRFRTRTRVRFHVFDTQSGELTVGQMTEAETRDFGPRGIFLAGIALPCATRVHLYLDIPDGCVEAFGVVVHDRPRTDIAGSPRAGVGVRLTHLSLDDEQRFEAFVADRRSADAAAMQAALVRIHAQRMTRRFGSVPWSPSA